MAMNNREHYQLIDQVISLENDFNEQACDMSNMLVSGANNNVGVMATNECLDANGATSVTFCGPQESSLQMNQMTPIGGEQGRVGCLVGGCLDGYCGGHLMQADTSGGIGTFDPLLDYENESSSNLLSGPIDTLERDEDKVGIETIRKELVECGQHQEQRQMVGQYEGGANSVSPILVSSPHQQVAYTMQPELGGPQQLVHQFHHDNQLQQHHHQHFQHQSLRPSPPTIGTHHQRNQQQQQRQHQHQHHHHHNHFQRHNQQNQQQFIGPVRTSSTSGSQSHSPSQPYASAHITYVPSVSSRPLYSPQSVGWLNQQQQQQLNSSIPLTEEAADDTGTLTTWQTPLNETNYIPTRSQVGNNLHHNHHQHSSLSESFHQHHHRQNPLHHQQQQQQQHQQQQHHHHHNHHHLNHLHRHQHQQHHQQQAVARQPNFAQVQQVVASNSSTIHRPLQQNHEILIQRQPAPLNTHQIHTQQSPISQSILPTNSQSLPIPISPSAAPDQLAETIDLELNTDAKFFTKTAPTTSATSQTSQNGQNYLDENGDLLDAQSVALGQSARRQFSSIENNQTNDEPEYLAIRSSGSLSQDWLDKICHQLVEHMNHFGICVIDNFLGSLKADLILKEVQRLYSFGHYTKGRLVSDKIEQKPLSSLANSGECAAPLSLPVPQLQSNESSAHLSLANNVATASGADSNPIATISGANQTPAVGSTTDTLDNQQVRAQNHVGAIRSDRVIWVDGCEQGCAEINNLIQTLCSVVTNSSRLSLYSNNRLDKIVITKRTKAHVACYPGNGTRYIKHVDNPNGDGRVITAIYYLNKNWNTKRDGGLLRMFPAGMDEVANIEPLFDRVLFFWSDRRNPHEVLPAYRDRFAITVWYIGENRHAGESQRNEMASAQLQ